MPTSHQHHQSITDKADDSEKQEIVTGSLELKNMTEKDAKALVDNPESDSILANGIAAGNDGITPDDVDITGSKAVPEATSRRLDMARRLQTSWKVSVDYIISLPSDGDF